jgi:hypothetical protein
MSLNAKLDSSLGVHDSTAECTCYRSTAGDHVSYSGCLCHAVADLVIQECCYCFSMRVLDAQSNCPCFKGYTRQHATLDAILGCND